MEPMESIQLQLPASIIASLNAAVENGVYHSPSEAAMAVLSQWQLRQKIVAEEFRLLIAEGEASGIAEAFTVEDIIAEARKQSGKRNV